MSMLHANPYLGPRAFTREHRLYGRDREVRDLTSLLVAERIVLLYSPSGAGKSSLVHAALIPTLEARQFRVLPVARVGLTLPADVPPSANRYLASVILSIGGDASREQTLADLVAPTEQMEDTVLVFDQFEELLTVDPLNRAAKAAFCRTVGDLLRQQRQLWALFVIREDYLAPLMEFAHYFPGRFRATFRLDLLSPAGALAAICQPARASGVEFAPEVARSLVDDLRRARVQLASDQVQTMLGDTVEPVQLQVVCYRLWQRLFPDGAPAGAQITAEAVQAVGAVDDALSDYYADRVAAAAAASGVRERVIREWFEQQLITSAGIRNQVLRGEGTTAGLPNAALPPLINAYLIRAEQRRNFIWYELAHDRLIEPVRQNNAAWRATLAPFQQQAALWARTDRPVSFLLRDADLRAAQAWAAAHPDQLEPVDQEFLAASASLQAQIEADRRRDRLIRRLGAVSAALAVVMLLAALAAFMSYREADHLAYLARARELAAEAAVNLTIDPQLSLLLARQAVVSQLNRNEPVDLTIEATLYRALAVARERAVFSFDLPVTALAVSADVRWWAVALLNDAGQAEIRLTEYATGQTRSLPLRAALVARLAFSPDSQRLAAVTWDGVLVLWDVTSGQEIAQWRHPLVARDPSAADTLEARLLDLAFAPDGTTIYTAGYDGWLRRWDVNTGQQAVIGGTDKVPLLSLTIDRDGARIAASNQQAELLIWRMQDSELVRRHSIGTQPVNGLVYTPAGSLVAIEGSRLLAVNGDEVFVLATFSSVLNAIQLDASGSLALIGSSDGNSYLVNLRDGRTIVILRGHTDQVSQIQWMANGHTVATASFDGTTRFWAVGDLQRFAPTTIAAAAQQGFLAVGGEDGTIALLTNPEGPAQLFLHHSDVIEMLAFSPDGRWLAAASADGQASIWNVANGQLLATIDHEARVRTVEFSRDGALLLTTSRSRAFLWRWQISTTQPIAVFDTSVLGEPEVITGAAIHPAQPWLAIVTRAGSTLIWDYQTNTIVARAADQQANGRVRFSPDGSLMLSQSNEDRLLLRESVSLALRDFPATHRGGIAGFAFDPGGTLIATVGFDQTARIWRISSGTEQMRMGSDDLAVDLAFSGIDEIAVVKANGSIARWPLDLLQALALAASRARRPTADMCERYQLVNDDSARCPPR